MEKVPTNKELKSNNKNKKTIVVGGDAIPTYDGFDFPPENCKEFEVLKKGEAEGVLIGGCLSVFNALCGTKYFPKLKNKILLIEDVGEKTYRIDLMLDQLKKQKDFDKVKAIIFGSFLNCKIADIGDGTIDEIIKNFVQTLDIPVIYNFPYGHIKSRFILPIGKKIKLKTKSSITF